MIGNKHDPKTVVSLDLSRSELKELPADIALFQRLERLVLNKNPGLDLRDAAKRLGKLKTITDISLHECAIWSGNLPQELLRLKSLERLDLGEGQTSYAANFFTRAEQESIRNRHKGIKILFPVPVDEWILHLDESQDSEIDRTATAHITDPKLKKLYRNLDAYPIYSLFYAETALPQIRDQLSMLQGMRLVVTRLLEKSKRAVVRRVAAEKLGYRGPAFFAEYLAKLDARISKFKTADAARSVFPRYVEIKEHADARMDEAAERFIATPKKSKARKPSRRNTR